MAQSQFPYAVPPGGSTGQTLAKDSNASGDCGWTTGGSGAPGPPGPQGPAGPTGSQGPQGVPGPTGATGAQGTPGAAGAQGPPGIQGPSGAAGAQGAQGLQGIQGIQGPAGAPGSSGQPLGLVVLANDTLAVALATTINVQLTVTAARTLTTTVPAAGVRCSVLVLTAGVSSFVITFGTGFRTVGTLATGTVASRVFVVSFISNGIALYETGRTAAMVA